MFNLSKIISEPKGILVDVTSIEVPSLKKTGSFKRIGQSARIELAKVRCRQRIWALDALIGRRGGAHAEMGLAEVFT